MADLKYLYDQMASLSIMPDDSYDYMDRHWKDEIWRLAVRMTCRDGVWRMQFVYAPGQRDHRCHPGDTYLNSPRQMIEYVARMRAARP